MATPNMNLPIPSVSVTDGPQYATDNNSCFTLIDAHDHTSGNGVPITPSGISINADLPYNGYSLTLVKKVGLSSQSAAITGTNFLSNVGGNLYFNDGSGNQIPITSAGGVAGSPGSIGSLAAPASATYSAGSKLFTWLADSAKSAAMDNGAVTIRETNVASAKGVTIASASGLAADYQLTLPAAVPASTQYVTSTSSGVLSFSTADNIASAMTSTGANAIRTTTTRSTGTTVGTGGVAISASSGGYSTTSSVDTAVTNLSVTITTSGRPVFVGLQSDGSGNTTALGCECDGSTPTSAVATFNILRGVTNVAQYIVELKATAAPGLVQLINFVPASSCNVIDAVAAGTYTYSITTNIFKTGATNALSQASYIKLVAYEL